MLGYPPTPPRGARRLTARPPTPKVQPRAPPPLQPPKRLHTPQGHTLADGGVRGNHQKYPRKTGFVLATKVFWVWGGGASWDGSPVVGPQQLPRCRCSVHMVQQIKTRCTTASRPTPTKCVLGVVRT